MNSQQQNYATKNMEKLSFNLASRSLPLVDLFREFEPYLFTNDQEARENTLNIQKAPNFHE